MSVAAAKAVLTSLEAELASVRERMAPHRRAWEDARMTVRGACVREDQARSIVTAWRAPSRGEAAWLDAQRAEFLSAVEHLAPEETRLKAAVREAERAVRDAEFEAKKAVRKAATSKAKGVNNDQLAMF